MKIGIMQPYFFPYLGYFQLIHYVDKFIFFDTPQYISRGWVNRNRILKFDGSVGYVTVPIQKAKRDTPINCILITKSVDWRKHIFGQLTAYKRKAPYYSDTIHFLHSVLDKDYEGHLSNLNIEITRAICMYLGIEKEFHIFSDMNIGRLQIKEPDDWALNITKRLGGDVYVNPPGGYSFFDQEKYKNENIRLEFIQSNLPLYVQRIGHFEAGLSIIDIMMFCTKKEIRDMLDDFYIF